MVYRMLISQYGIQPSEIAKMTIPMVEALIDTTGEIVTLRDIKALEKFMHGR